MDYLLLFWVILSVFLPGLALIGRLTRLEGLDRVTFGAVSGVLFQALLGLLLATGRWAHRPVIITSVSATVLAAVYLFRGRKLRFLAELGRSRQFALLLWLLFNVACISITYLRPVLPRDLPDGRYVFKGATESVELQYVATLPADNLLPYLVSEYFLRRISFKTEHPILPGNEVSNRTILMSLVAMPYRAMAMPPRMHAPLGRFFYVTKLWPSVMEIYSGEAYRQFMVVGIFLNSLLLLGLIGVFAGRCFAPGVVIWATLLYMTNPYLIGQTIFIWPKALAGFFLVLAWESLRRNYAPILVGLCLGLAYHSHPFAIAFVGAGGLFYLFRWWKGAGSGRDFILFTAVVTFLIAPWLLWTRLILGLPSDLFWQNVSGPGTEVAMAHIIDFIWVRFYNFFALLTPIMFFVYPFKATTIIEFARDCLPGATGVLLTYQGILQAYKLMQPRALWWLMVVLPYGIITALFSYQSPTVLHGYQAAVGALIFLGVHWSRRNLHGRVFWVLLTLQLAMNLSFLGMNAYAVRLHIPLEQPAAAKSSR